MYGCMKICLLAFYYWYVMHVFAEPIECTPSEGAVVIVEQTVAEIMTER